MFFELVVANLAHPATPTLIKNLQLPNYTFGAAFAAMSFTNFLFSPFWGRLSDRIGRMKVYAISCVGYALGQFLFMLATTEYHIFMARGVAGLFIGGIGVTQLTYVMDRSLPQDRATNLTIHATIFTVAGAVGYLIGGFLGEISIPLLFMIQVVGLLISGLWMYLKVSDVISIKHLEWNKAELLKASNPFSAFTQASKIMDKWLWILLAIVLFSTFGSIAYDQSFNYYLKDQLGFSPSYNGLLKAGFGLLGLIINSTLCIYIIRKTNIKIPLLVTMMSASMLSFLAYLSTSASIFIILSVAFFAFNSIYMVLIQTLAGKANRSESSGSFMGLYNSAKSLGMILGSLVAGMVYGILPGLAFVLAGSMFLFGSGFLGLYLKRKE